MALFSKKPKAAALPKAEIVPKEKGKATHATTFAHVIAKPRITEKAGAQSEKNVYTFEVTKDATKGKVKSAIKELYKVTPVRVNIVNLPEKRVFVRGKFGRQKGIKKALVYLKKGDKIEFV